VEQAVRLGQRRQWILDRAEEADAALEVRPVRPCVQRCDEGGRVARERSAREIERERPRAW